MDSRIPLPTDNIFKFYALFSLFLFVFACGLMTYTTKNFNERNLNYLIEIETLKSISDKTSVQELKLEAAERLYEISISDKKLYSIIIAILLVISIIGIGYGFFQWHSKIQPLDDELLQLRLEKEKLELQALRKSMGVTAEIAKE